MADPKCTEVDVAKLWQEKDTGHITEAEVEFTYSDGTTRSVTVRTP